MTMTSMPNSRTRRLAAVVIAVLIAVTVLASVALTLGGVTENRRWVEWGTMLAMPVLAIAVLPIVAFVLLLALWGVRGVWERLSALREPAQAPDHAAQPPQQGGDQLIGFGEMAAVKAERPAEDEPAHKPAPVAAKVVEPPAPAAALPPEEIAPPAPLAGKALADAWLQEDGDPHLVAVKRELHWRKTSDRTYAFTAPRSHHSWQKNEVIVPVCVELLKRADIDSVTMDAKGVDVGLFDHLSLFMEALWKEFGVSLVGRFHLQLPNRESIVELWNRMMTKLDRQAEDGLALFTELLKISGFWDAAPAQ